MTVVRPGWRTIREGIKPGDIFGVFRGRELLIGLATEPMRESQHHPSWLILHASASPDLAGKFVARIESANSLLLFSDVEVRFAHQDVQYGDRDDTPSGALILSESEHGLFARADNGNEFLISLEKGAIGGVDLYRSFWTPRWRLMHAHSDDAAQPIFEFGPAAEAI